MFNAQVVCRWSAKGDGSNDGGFMFNAQVVCPSPFLKVNFSLENQRTRVRIPLWPSSFKEI